MDSRHESTSRPLHERWSPIHFVDGRPTASVESGSLRAVAQPTGPILGATGLASGWRGRRRQADVPGLRSDSRYVRAKTDRVETVDCSETHEAKITAIVETEAKCPGRATSLKLTSGRFACAVSDA